MKTFLSKYISIFVYFLKTQNRLFKEDKFNLNCSSFTQLWVQMSLNTQNFLVHYTVTQFLSHQPPSKHFWDHPEIYSWTKPCTLGAAKILFSEQKTTLDSVQKWGQLLCSCPHSQGRPSLGHPAIHWYNSTFCAFVNLS